MTVEVTEYSFRDSATGEYNSPMRKTVVAAGGSLTLLGSTVGVDIDADSDTRFTADGSTPSTTSKPILSAVTNTFAYGRGQTLKFL